MTIASSPTVYCVVPVHNRLQITREFLRQMAQQDYPSVRIVVVDDGSSDGTGEFLDALHETNIHVLRGDGSLWWGGAMNMGMRYVFGVAHDRDYLLMLNDDVRIGPSYVSVLVDDSVANHGAVVGSAQRDDISGNLIGSGYEVDYRRMSFRTIDPQGAAVAVDALPGRGTLFPMSVARRAGYIHERLPHHLGDLEYTARVKESAHPLLVSWRAEVFTGVPLGSDVRRTKSWKRWTGRRSPNNAVQRLVFFLARGPLVCRVLAIPRFALLAVKKLTLGSD